MSEEFKWERHLPKFETITLEYGYAPSKEGEKLGYLNQYIVPGDIYGFWDVHKEEFTLELLYDENLYLREISNSGNHKFLGGGTELLKVCHVLL